MFIRECVTTNKNTGVKYVTHRLVESYRVTQGSKQLVKQRVILHLGKLDLPKSQWPKLAKALEARLAGQGALFEDDPQIASAADKAMEQYEFKEQINQAKVAREEKRNLVRVDLESVNKQMSRSLGPELVAHAFWQRLGFNELLEECGLNPLQQSLAEGVILGRLIKPGSELAMWRWLSRQTSLTELLPVDLQGIGKDSVYEIGDVLLAHKETLEKGLGQREMAMFPRERALFLYDLTNTYFEGSSLKNTLAHHGNSKEKRTDCPLVVLALVVDYRGFPIFSQIYKGNQSEPQTLEEILNRLYHKEDTLFNETLPTIVMDRGIATRENLELLKGKKFPYIVIERRQIEKEYVKEFESAKETFSKIDTSGDQTVYVKKVTTEDSCRVLCLSEGREQKERAMDTLKEGRFLQDLARLESSVSKGNILLVTKVSERIGRLKERYPSIASHYEIQLTLDEAQKKVVNLTWEKKASRAKKAALAGCYVIETSHRELDAPEIWQLYTTLTQVENAFRDLKTDLGLRPIHHQLAERTEAHLFISVLAYHLLITIERKLIEKGDHRRWSTIRDELSTHQRGTVVMTTENDEIYHIRVSDIPETEHKEIYRLLDVRDPLKRKTQLVGKRL